MIARAQRSGRGELVRGFRRKQKRKPRRLLEASKEDFARWDAAAELEGVNWSEFTRRALLARVSSVGELEEFADQRPALRETIRSNNLRGLSEKPAPKNGAGVAGKKRAAAARGKGSSRS